MKKNIIIFCWAFIFLSFSNPALIADEWDTATLEKANTAKDIPYLTEEEKKVVLYINLARLKPDLFAQTYYAKYLDSAKIKPTPFTTSLKNDLLTRYKPMDVLTVKQDLTQEAKEHATDTGKKGNMGHFSSSGISYETRMKKFKGIYGEMAENCDYGHEKAMNIVMNLLIDEGQGSAQHRKTILDKRYKYIGVSIQPHKKHKWTCVMEFANDKK